MFRTLLQAFTNPVAGPAGFALALVMCGLRPGRPSARWLWDHRVAAVAADNPGLEAMPASRLLSPEDRRRLDEDPGSFDELMLHGALLPMLGMPIGELWDLDALADACAADGRYVFRVTASDRPSNPANFARDAELVSAPVLIDNTPPVVTAAAPVRNGTSVTIDVDATDRT